MSIRKTDSRPNPPPVSSPASSPSKAPSKTEKSSSTAEISKDRLESGREVGLQKVASEIAKFAGPSSPLEQAKTALRRELSSFPEGSGLRAPSKPRERTTGGFGSFSPLGSSNPATEGLGTSGSAGAQVGGQAQVSGFAGAQVGGQAQVSGFAGAQVGGQAQVSGFAGAKVSGQAQVGAGIGVSGEASVGTELSQARGGGFGISLPSISLPSPGEILDAGRDFVEDKVNETREFVEDKLSRLGEMAQGVASGIGDAFGAAADKIKQTGETVIEIGGQAIDFGKDMIELMASDPGADAEHPITRGEMNPIDKAMVNVLGLDKMQPGQKTEIKVKAEGDLAAVLGVEVGAEVTLAVQRNPSNPNEFTFSVGGGANVDGEVKGDTTGADANVGVGVGAGVGLEFKVDFSKENAGTEFGAFLAHTGLMAGLPAPLSAAALAIENLPGVNLPGEPLDYIKNHISAVNIGADVHMTGELGAVLGAGAEGNLMGYLKGGGRIEFNADGSKTLSTNIAAGGNATLSLGAGAGGFDAMFEAAGLSGELGLGQKITFDKDWKATDHSFTGYVSFSGSGSIGPFNGGVEGKMSFDLNTALDQVPPQTKEQVLDALKGGHVEEALSLIKENVLSNVALTGKLDINAKTKVAGSTELEASVGGVGAGLDISGQISTSIPLFSGSATLDKDGFRFNPAQGVAVDQFDNFRDLLESLAETVGK